jgi:hypothetical protein
MLPSPPVLLHAVAANASAAAAAIRLCEAVMSASA